MMLERDAITRAAEILERDDFYRDGHRKIFDAILALYFAQQPVDLITTCAELRNRGDYEESGGAAYLTAMIEACPSAANITTYASEVRKQSYDRQRVIALQNGLQQARNCVGPAEAAKQVLKNLQHIEEQAARAQALRYSTDLDLDDLLGRIEWLWPGWVPRGMVTTIVARQEAGKSNFALDLCGRLLTCGAWPDGTPTSVDPGETRLLWIDTELALAGFRDRVVDWGLPRGRFILPSDPLHVLQFDNPTDWAWIEGSVAKFRPPLVVIDALSGGHRGEEKDNDSMKVILQRLSQLAQAHKIAVVAIHHLRKSGPGENDWPITIDQVRGASAITQFSRSIIGLGIPDKTQPELRRIDVIKSNFAKKPEPLGYQITDHGLAWGAAPEAPRPQKAIEAARAFLLEELKSGPRPSQEVFKEAEESGLCSRRTLENAISSLKLRSYKERGDNGRWFLDLPNRPAPESEE
jgi:hypothetical protein